MYLWIEGKFQLANIPFYIIQTIIFFSSSIICFFTTYSVYSRDKSYALNRIFASASFFLGFFNLSMGFSNFPVILWEEQVIILAIQVAYSFLVLSLGLFLLSSFILQFGTAFPFRNAILPVLGTIILVDGIVMWLTEAFTPTETPGDIVTSTFFKIVVLGSLALFYVVTLVLFIRTYQVTTGNVRKNVSWFLFGWGVGGLALIASALSDFIQILDLIGPILLAIAIVIQQQGFRRRAWKNPSSLYSMIFFSTVCHIIFCHGFSDSILSIYRHDFTIKKYHICYQSIRNLFSPNDICRTILKESILYLQV